MASSSEAMQIRGVSYEWRGEDKATDLGGGSAAGLPGDRSSACAEGSGREMVSGNERESGRDGTDCLSGTVKAEEENFCVLVQKT
jgi:hypothetical protein